MTTAYASVEERADLPDGWVEVTLAQLLGTSGVFSDGDWVESKDQDPAGDVRLIQLADVGDGAYHDKSCRFLTSGKAQQLGCTFLRAGDILVARMPDPLGRACIFPGDAKPAVTVVDVCIIRPPSGGPDPRWLLYTINSPQFRGNIEDYERGTTRKRISRRNLGIIPMPLPPLAEQKRIVAKVEQLLARVNAVRQRLAKAAPILKRFRQSVLAAACSGQLTADWREGHASEPVARAVERLGLPQVALRTDLDLIDLPDGWMWSNVRALIDRREAFCYGVVQPGADGPNGVFLVRAGDLSGGTVDTSQLRRIPKAIDAAYVRSRLRGGELLVTVVGAGIGESAIAPPECAGFNIARAVAKLPIRQFSARYVHLWLQTQTARAWMDDDACEVARPTLNLEQLQTLPVPLPPFNEQQEIVRRVEALFALADKIEARVQAATARVEKITQAILAKAFRGELVPTEADLARAEGRPYESAAELLERIRTDRDKCTGSDGAARARRRKHARSPSVSSANRI